MVVPLYVLPLGGGSPHFVDSSASKLLSACIVYTMYNTKLLELLLSIFHFILGEPPFALRGFEAVSSDHHIFLLLFFFWLCNPYAGISGLILFVFKDLDIYFVCFILADPPKVPGSLGKI